LRIEIATRSKTYSASATGYKQHSRVSDQLPIKAGPVPDRVSLWPLDDGRYGLDAIFQGASGYQRMEQHEQELNQHRVPHSVRQELGGAWAIRLGPLRAVEVARALGAFVY
jgi:hypothetical protein